MSIDTHPAHPAPDFLDRLERSLEGADQERKRRLWMGRLRAMLPVILLVGPILGWRLILASPDGVHVGVAALAWVTFLLDVGIQVDTALLSYLGLQQLPSIVGALLFLVLTASLLTHPEEKA